MLQPVGHRVLVKIKLKEHTDSGIVLVHDPRYARAAMESGEIVSIGPNAWKAFDDGQPWAVVGDKVVFSKYGGKIVEDPDNLQSDPNEYFMVLNDEDILCKVVD